MKSVSTKPVVLVTGFEPFGGETINPSWEIAKSLPEEIGRHRVVAVRVPTAFGRAIDTTAAAIKKHNPSVVLCLGQAGGRAAISIERVAININDARIADNAGQQPIDESITSAGPAAYFATLPIKAMVDAVRKKGIPAEVSNTAGTFVCNHLMYGVLHHLATTGSSARAGFVHVPFLPSQVTASPGTASMSLEMMRAGIEVAIASAIKNSRDRKLVGGALN